MTETVHAVHTLCDDGIRTMCGLVWQRWETTTPYRATAQWQDVTCPECKGVNNSQVGVNGTNMY